MCGRTDVFTGSSSSPHDPDKDYPFEKTPLTIIKTRCQLYYLPHHNPEQETDLGVRTWYVRAGRGLTRDGEWTRSGLTRGKGLASRIEVLYVRDESGKHKGA